MLRFGMACASALLLLAGAFVGHEIEANVFADRFFPREEPVRHRTADDDHERCVAAIARIEIAAAYDGYVHHGEEARRDGVVVGGLLIGRS